MANNLYPDNQSCLTADVTSKIAQNADVWGYIESEVQALIKANLPKNDVLVVELLRTALVKLCGLTQIDDATWEVYDTKDKLIATVITKDQYVLDGKENSIAYENGRPVVFRKQAFNNMKALLNYLSERYTPRQINEKKLTVTHGTKSWKVESHIVPYSDEFAGLGIHIEFVEL